MKKIISGFLLLVLLSQPLLAAQSASGSVNRIREITYELEEIQRAKDSYLLELENTNNERRIEIEERVKELNEREAELQELRRQLTLFGDLIDNQAVYTRKLERSVKFWKTISGILATSLITIAAIWGASK